MSSSGRQQVDARRRKINPLNKRIPKNPRYKHVRSVLDTGASMSRYMEKVEEIRQNYRFRPGEIFKRLKCVTFAHMVLQVFTFVEPEPPAEDLAVVACAATPPEAEVEDALSSPGRTTFAQVAHGIGEKTDTVDSGSAQETLSAIPFLILDVRPKDEYDKCHIITARSYPAAMLTRSCNYFTQEILQYKNADGKVIILYDDDERIAADCATTFVQRDVANVFMLSGGLKVMSAQFPQGMIIGDLPDTLRPPPQRAPGSRATTTGGSRMTAASRRTGAGVRATSGAASRTPRPDPNDDTPESRPLVTPPPKPLASLVPRPGWFSVDDIQSIEETLDELLLDSDRSASRSTASRSATSASSAAGRLSAASRPPTQRSAPASGRASKPPAKIFR